MRKTRNSFRRRSPRKFGWNSERQRPTVGALNHAAKTDLNQSDTWETTQEREKEIMRNLLELVASNRQKVKGDFFVMLLSKKEKLLTQVIRDRLFALKACPTPNYGQTLWKYHHLDQRLEFIWTVPPKDVVMFLKRYPIEMSDMCGDLIRQVFNFIDGTLDRRTIELNRLVRL